MSARYAWAGGEELLHLLPGADGHGGHGSIVIALPPFEEANRTRALAATIARSLQAAGWTVAIPDLPGQGDSLQPTAAATLTDWRHAFAAAAVVLPAPVFAVTIRGGALVDTEAAVASRWRLAPQEGSALARELARLTAADGSIAGNRVAPTLVRELAAATLGHHGAVRTVRLASEGKSGDRIVDAAPLWRRAEPDNDPALAAVLAADVLNWIERRPATDRAATAPLSTPADPGRRIVRFACEGETLVGTLDPAPGDTGLLIVSGGNEIRTGAHRGMALLAERIATAGQPVLRFDRRGIGDSTGTNGGFERNALDLAAAVAHFCTAQPQLSRIVGFGNCDAASALALFGTGAGIDAVILANPWTSDAADDLPPPAAIRARYARRLRDPRAWGRLLRGGVDLRKLARGVARARATAPSGLAARLRAAWPADATVLTARGDNTAVAFRAALPGVVVRELDSDSHSFAGPGDADWLFAQVLEALAPPR